jgi:hypothetical protein
MSHKRPSTVQERESAIAIMRENRAAGRPLYRGTAHLKRKQTTLKEWFEAAEAALPRIRPPKPEPQTTWPKPFWESQG